MKLQGYYKLITSKIKKGKTDFLVDATNYKFYKNRDNFYVVEDGEKVYVLDETDNVMIQDRTGYYNVDLFDPIAKEAFTYVVNYMDSKYYS